MDIRRVDLNLLVVFDTLLRTRNVSRAAESLGISQPATSFALNRLRRMLGDPLFVRSSHGIVATPYAEALTPPLQDVLDKIRSDLLKRPTFESAAARRVFTLDMSDIGELVFLPRIVEHVATRAPGIDIRTASMPAAEIETSLRSGEVDLAVGNFGNLRSAMLYQQRLFGHSYIVVVRKDHPGIGDAMSRKQFLEGHHAVVHPEGQPEGAFEAALRQQGLTRRVVLRLKHYLAIPAILRESNLIFTVPYAIGTSLAEFANIRLLKPPISTPRADIKQFWHARFHHDPANQWIRGVVAELFLEQRRRARRGSVGGVT